MKEKIKENTTAAASGAVETPFLTPEEMEYAERRHLVETHVYGVPKAMGAKLEPLKGMENFAKGNLKDENTPYGKKSMKATEDQSIEAHANGMTDLNYDSLPPKAAEQMKNAVLAGDKQVGNGPITTKTGEKILADSKKRMDANPNLKIGKYEMSGSDIENNTNKNQKTPNIVESKIKKIKVNEVYLNEASVQKFLDKTLKESYKTDGNVFFFEDAIQNRYKIQWEGGAKGEGVIVESYNVKQKLKEANAFENITNFNTNAPAPKVLAEDANFMDFYKKMKNDTKDL